MLTPHTFAATFWKCRVSPSAVGGHAGFIGDYNGLVISGNAIVPVWSDSRNSSGVEIFTARGTLVPQDATG